jgi:hypothetical protein
MTRTILAGLAVAIGAVSFLGTGCQSSGVGDPCTPEQEYDPTFAGFAKEEVSTEGESFQCQTRLCLVNHFQGRVSCPYGQDTMGNPINANGLVSPATAGCVTPGINSPVTTPTPDPVTGFGVNPQCTERTADKTVYCSCRCADINGTQQGGNFCKCPSGFSCTQLVSSLSAMSDQGLTGAYCIKDGTAFSESTTTATASACTFCGSTGSANCGPLANTGGS